MIRWPLLHGEIVHADSEAALASSRAGVAGREASGTDHRPLGKSSLAKPALEAA